MKSFLAIAVWLLAAHGALAQYAPPPSVAAVPADSTMAAPRIHPAVARIVAPGDGTISYGSGTLVYVGEQYGLVITNWHVINEATGPISVHFPDGFYSIGTVQKIDRDWDLAIIAIHKPAIRPVPLAAEAPRPGELLTIAGYGSGHFRATGPCTQYVAPGTTFPFEMVEVAVSARQGDSGGPILNSQGELAGVLFGEGNGRTSGSYCGRVRWFLSSVAPAALASPQAIAATSTLAPVAPRPGGDNGRSTARIAEAPLMPASASSVRMITTAAPPSAPPPVVASTRAAEPAQPPTQPSTQVIGWEDLAGETIGEQVKTVLAAIGVLAVLLHALKWMSTEPAKT